MRDHLDFNTPEFNQLVEDLKGRHAARMNQLLDELPDRAFRIVYPKLLEFVFPKPQRLELPKVTGDENRVLRIEVVTRPEQLLEPPLEINGTTVEEEE